MCKVPALVCGDMENGYSSFFFNKPTTKRVEVSNPDTSNIYSTPANTDTAVEAVSENTSSPGTCSTGAIIEMPTQPAATSRDVKNLGEKATGQNSP